MKFPTSLFHTHVPTATILIRLMVGGIFLSEGIQKFLDPAVRGAGRRSVDDWITRSGK